MSSTSAVPAIFHSPRRFVLLGALGASGYACGVWGILEVQRAEGGPGSWPSALYHAGQLFLLDTEFLLAGVPPQLQFARYACALTAAATLVSLLMATLGTGLRGHLGRLRGGHVLVVGPGPIALAVAENARAQGHCVLLLASREKADELRSEAGARFPFLVGDLDQETFLARCGARTAARVLAVGRDDADNLAVGSALERIAPPDGGQLRKVLVSNPGARASLDAGPGFLAGIEAVSLDIHERRARRLLDELPLDFLALPEPEPGAAPRRATLIVIGWSPLAAAVAVQAGRIAHYPSGARTRLVRVTAGAAAELEAFERRWPALDEVLEVVSARHAPGDPGLRALLVSEFERAAEHAEPVTVLISSEAQVSDHLGTALWIQRMLPPGCACVRLIPDLGDVDELAAVLRSPSFREAHPDVIGFFGPSLAETLGPDLDDTVDGLARGLHAEYLRSRGLARAGATAGPTRPAERPWEHLDESFRIATRALADHLPIKLRALGCEVVPLTLDEESQAEPSAALTPQEVELLARLEHRRWCAERRLAGWTFAHERDDRQLHHDLLVPWEALAESDRYLDRDVVTGALRALRPMGLTVRRKG